MQKKRLGIFPNLGKENVRIALPEFVQLCKDWGLNRCCLWSVGAAVRREQLQ